MTARSKKKTIFFILLVFVAGLVFAGLFNVGVSATNEMAFCTSCHSMQVPYQEYQESVHFKNAAGVQATCSDCHVPKPFGPKMVANRVWAKMEASDSRECRSCHEFGTMDLSEQDRMARKRHSAAMDEGQTCIDCHKGVAHEEPDDPSI